MTTTQRKLATILAADAAGYSRLMGDDDKATVQTLTDYRLVFTGTISRHQGRVVDTAGDSVLAVFESPVEAVECSIDIQNELARRNRQLAEHRRMHFRIGLNLGDVITREDGTVYGDGVNIAARLQAIAEPGGICISANVHEQVEVHLPLTYADIGEQVVRNIAKPVRAYKVHLQGGMSASILEPAKPWTVGRWVILAGVVVTMLVAIGAGAWWWKDQSSIERTTARAQSDKPTIAVLPFQNLSGDPKQEYFADGISEELITLLTQFRDVSVIARNSMFTYKGKAVDVRVVGKEMHADFVLEGSVRRAADTVRVTAQLLSAKDGKHLWAETFERKLTVGDLFALQDEISERVATSIAGDYGIIKLSHIRETSRKPPNQIQSYECILRVYEYNRLVTPESRALATECLKRVTTSDPQYADAWSWLAMCYIDEYVFGSGDALLQLEKGREAVKKALSVDPSNPIAATAEAYYLYFKRDPRFFDKSRKAVVANPRDFATLGQMGLSLSWAGKWNEGRVLLDRAIAVSPRPPGWVYLPISHRAYLDGDYRKGLEFGLKIDMPGYHWYHVAVAPNYARLGMKKEAQAEVALLQKSYPDFESHAYEEFRKWMWVDSEMEALIQGLRDAGMNIPPDSSAH